MMGGFNNFFRQMYGFPSHNERLSFFLAIAAPEFFRLEREAQRRAKASLL